MKLTKKDYEKILSYYGKKPVYNVNKKTRKKKYNMKKTKELTRQVLSSKLCKCIKKVQKANKKLDEKGAIAICRESIFTNRGLKHYAFTCKKGARFYPKKGTNKYVVKTRKVRYKPKR